MTFFVFFVGKAFQIYRWILIARILLSWINHDPYHPLIKFVYQVTEPLLAPLSRVIPPIGMVDISPIVAFFLLGLLEDFVMRVVLGGGSMVPGMGF